MNNGIADLPVKVYYDPRIVELPREYQVQIPSEELSDSPYVSQGSSDASVAFNITANNDRTFCDRQSFNITYNALVTITGASAGVFFPPITPYPITQQLKNQVALRHMPITSASSLIQLSINNTAVNYNPMHVEEALFRSYDKDAENEFFSLGPSMHDVSQEYTDAVGTAANPLNTFFANTAQIPRGAYQYLVVEDNILTNYAIISFTWTEPVLISPLIMSKLNSSGLIGLTTLNINYNITNINRIVSIDPNILLAGGAYVSSSATIANTITTAYGTYVPAKPVLYLKWLRSPFDYNPQGKYEYPYLSFQDFPNIAGNLAGGAQMTINTQNIQLAGVPQRLYVYAKVSDAFLFPTQTDSYAYISAISVSFNTRNGLLNQTPAYELWRLSQANGVKISWPEWQRTIGSVICLDFGKDLPLPDGLSVGQLGSFNLIVNATINNIGVNAKNYTLYLVPVYEGIFTIAARSAVTNINLVTDADIAKGKLSLENNAAEDLAVHDSLQGGNLFHTGRHLVKRAHKLYHQGKAFYEEHKDTIDAAISSAKNLGLAAKYLLPLLVGQGHNHQEIVEGLRRHGYNQLEIQSLGSGLSGGGLSGGRLITNGQQLITGGSLPLPRRQFLKYSSNY